MTIPLGPDVNAPRVRIEMSMTCDFHESWDDQKMPAGTRCGQPVTHEIDWTGGLVSFGCAEHVTSDVFEQEALDQILYMGPIRP